MIYDVCDEIPPLSVPDSNEKYDAQWNLDNKITFMLDKQVKNIFDEDLYKEIVPKDELKVSLDEFDRMMSQWNFIITLPEIIKLKPLTPAEMYTALINEYPTENLTH